MAPAVIEPTITLNGSETLQPRLSETVTVYVAFVAGIDLLEPVPNPLLQVYVYGEVPPNALAVTVIFGPAQTFKSGILSTN